MYETEDNEVLLEDAEEDGDNYPPKQTIAPDPHAALPVYATIHRIRRLVIASVDDPYTLEQLREPSVNELIVQPFVGRVYDPDDISIVYCLLVNRMQFLREQKSDGLEQSVSTSRAHLCELVATQLLWRFHHDHDGPEGLLLLANILVAGFEPFQNAPEDVLREKPLPAHWPVQKRGGYERKLTALEIAIVSTSKVFLSSPATQKVVDAVYRGQIVYTPLSFVDILPDHYKHRPISLYDPHKAPVLNQYRLIVPRIRIIIEVGQFAVLLALYILTMSFHSLSGLTVYEVIFCVYTTGWILEEFAAIIEHGWQVHTQNLWSFLDITFIVIYAAYFIVRIYSLISGRLDPGLGLNILAIAAPVLLPRLAFNLMPDNMLFISLRAMMRDFIVLTLLAVWCFAGFFVSMKWLTYLNEPAKHHDILDSTTVSKWMLWIWFGLDGTGIERSVDFHQVLGPSLMIVFAFLGNTLFLTVLVAMLTNTFSKIVANESAEIQFRRAVLTFEGVKSDAIFAYPPPFNVLALIVLLPTKFILSPRHFHKVNVFAIRLLNAPILLLIAACERPRLWRPPNGNPRGSPKRRKLAEWIFSGFSPHGDIQAVFDIKNSHEVADKYDNSDIFDSDIREDELSSGQLRGLKTQKGLQRRRRSMSV
ncbi:uncharacterized protein A1O5_05783 [Cladophialophora psammophila CBS 110553]|uniref:Ion transport domain-containing protein n=1 Tax=Cladophialophora psammophila CBS 110553 TaxID=1182543 RepID=W9WS77_9EURO|nr:uncharacterized protein A1O5_05783 [Cladophialophora psammophila CBS 110553]EXJ70793.1 hypothetical protein A1O5_05783 [Cladophialophora psammophila CBS 110553]